MTADEIDNIGRFLRVLNATFNLAMASTRFEAGATMLKVLGGTGFTTQTRLFELAKVEVDDATRVVNEVPNLGAGNAALQSVSGALADLIATTTVDARTKKIDNVRSLLTTAASGFGTGMLYRIGDGAVMF
jgi:hypothetical protein